MSDKPYREKMREYLEAPENGDDHYGKWGILNKEQRQLITRLLNEMDGADAVIANQQKEIEKLRENNGELAKFILNLNPKIINIDKDTLIIERDNFAKIQI